MNTTSLDVGIVSAGKVGAALGSALRAAGHSVIGAYATSEESLDRLENMLPGVPALDVQTIVERSQLVVFAVPDRELIPVVNGLTKLGAWQPGQIVVHTAGRYGADILAGAAGAGALTLAIHPAMTFTGTSLDIARLQGCPFSVSAAPMLQPIGLALVTEMGGEGTVIADADRPLYHAALAHGANHLVTVVAQAERVLAEIGIDDPGAYLRPLTQAALEGALSSGETLQTGPVVRGDAITVRGHLDKLDELADDVPQLADVAQTYRALTHATVARALSRGVINESQAEEMINIVEES